MSTTVTEEEKQYKLVCSDGVVFQVQESVAVMSQTIKNIIDDDCYQDGIPLPNVDGPTMSKVIDYCKKHADAPKFDNEAAEDSKKVAADLKAWDQNFVNLDQAILYDILMASNYLNINDLLQLICQKVADMIKGRTPEQTRQTFNIKNDFSAEEEAAIRQENSWAFE